MLGRQNNFGAPLKLVHSVEDTHYAKALKTLCKMASVEKPLEEYTPEDYKEIEVETNYTFPERRWELVFERGVVFSQGPTLSGL
jgi:hypothetical protein